MANGAEEARKFAIIMTVSASVSALLALAFWSRLIDPGFDDTTRWSVVALLVVVCVMEIGLGRMLYLRKIAGK